jgi:hypothetical protein
MRASDSRKAAAQYDDPLHTAAVRRCRPPSPSCAFPHGVAPLRNSLTRREAAWCIAVWRYLLSAIALFALFIATGDAFDANRYGDISVAYRTISDDQAIITGVEAGSVAHVRETYAPDEIDAMNYALQHVGIQLDAIRTARLQTHFTKLNNSSKPTNCSAPMRNAYSRKSLA